MSKDYYKTLGVEKTASESEIKKAFYKQAQKYHPDKPNGDESKFKEANEAYQVLSNKQKRAQYDQFGSAGPGGGGFGGFQGGQGFDFNGVDLEDILSQFGFGGGFGGFGGGRPRRGSDVQMHLELSFKEAVLGVTKEIEVPDLITGGDKNKKVSVTIPAGVESGQRVRLPGYGQPIEGGEPGNMYLVIIIEPHETLRREGQHLVVDLEVKLTDAILGAKYEVDTLDGKVGVKVPAGLQSGQLLRMRGKGVPGQSGMFGQGTGDLIIQTKINIPKKLSKKAKKAIDELKGEGL